MITNTGKDIIAKYLIGNAPAYASYIAVGCGAKPRPNIYQLTGGSGSSFVITVTNTAGLWVGAKVDVTSGTGSFYDNTKVTQIISGTQFRVDTEPSVALSGATISLEIPYDKQVLDFEMFRVPIVSKGYVYDQGKNKVVLTAELPSEERYEISEVGIFSAGTNSLAGAYDSKTLFAFSTTEQWRYSNNLTLTDPTLIVNSLIDTATNVITSTADAIQTNSNNTAFLNATRAARYERCRYFNNILMLRGNTSHITKSNGNFVINTDAKYLKLSGQTVDFTRNSTADLLKVAFSIINVNGNDGAVPDAVRVAVKFSNTDKTQVASFESEVTNTSNNFASNRYMVVAKRLDELKYTTVFSWDAVNTIEVYVSAINALSITNKARSSSVATLTTSAAHGLTTGDRVTVTGVNNGFDGTYLVTGTPSTTTFTYGNTGATVTSSPVSPNGSCDASRSTYFVALDAIRLDNVATANPLYGMTGYSIIQNLNAETILKTENTTNYIEFRFVLDVTG